MSIPLGVLDLVPISSGRTPPQALRNSIDLARAGRAVRLHALLVRRAPPQPGRRRHVPGRRPGADRRGHLHDPARLGRRTARTPHGAVDGRGVRAPRRAAPRPIRSGPRPVRRAAGSRAASRVAGPAQPAPGRRRPGAQRTPHPAKFSLGGPARLARGSRCSSGCSQQPQARAAGLRRAGRRHPRPDRRHLPRPPRASRRTSSRGRAPTCRSGSSAAAAARAPTSPAHAACASRPTTTSARPPCWRRPRATGPRSARRRCAGRRTSACPRTWSSPRTRRPRASSPPATGSWVRSIRTGAGAIQFPTPDEARRHHWTDEDRALVADRRGDPVRRFAGPGGRPVSSSCATPPARTSWSSRPSPTPRRPGALLRAAGPGVVQPLTRVRTRPRITDGSAPARHRSGTARPGRSRRPPAISLMTLVRANEQ